jgi:hypothetical protein
VPCIIAVLEALSEADVLAEVLAEVDGSWLVDTGGSSVGASLVCSAAVAVVPVTAAALVAIFTLSSGLLVMALATS